MRTGLVRIITTALLLCVSALWNSAGAQQLMSDLSNDSVDAEYKKRKLTVRGEFVQAWQETSGPNLKKDGFYAETAYRINSKYEPVVRYDQSSLDDGTGHDIKRSTIGLIYYPNPELHPIFNFRISQSFVHDDGTGDSKHEFVAQCVIGF